MIKPRVLITTDIGGSDPDDIQSLIHVMFYTDILDVVGIVCGCKNGSAGAAKKVIKKYGKDYPKLLEKGLTYLKSPTYLQACVKQGNKKPSPSAGYSSNTIGSNWIASCAKNFGSAANPLIILAWGSLTDVAQALSAQPSIADKIFVYAINSWNKTQDPNAYEYVRKNRKVRLIVNDSTFRGMYLTGIAGSDRYSNRGFVHEVIKDAGALGKYFHKVSESIDIGSYGLKMGDTPSALWIIHSVLNGFTLDPAMPSWGGRFKQIGEELWTDSPAEQQKIGTYKGAKTVAKWRMAFLKHWEQRLLLLHGK